MFLLLFTLRSARVSALVIFVEWKSVWKNRKIGDLSDFERGQFVGARLAEAAVIKTATLVGVSRATVS
jgi:hypothetical protein